MFSWSHDIHANFRCMILVNMCYFAAFWVGYHQDGSFCCCYPGCLTAAFLALCLLASPCPTCWVCFLASCLAVGLLLVFSTWGCLHSASNGNACLVCPAGSLALWGDGTFEPVVYSWKVQFLLLILCFLTSPFLEVGSSPSLQLVSLRWAHGSPKKCSSKWISMEHHRRHV